MEHLVVSVEDTEGNSRAEHTFRKSPARLGRSGRNELCLPHPFVSAWHALIEFGAGSIAYTDLGSTNGSVLNDADLVPHEAARVGRGDVVVIGPYHLTFELRAAPAAAPPRPPGAGGAAPQPVAEPGRVRPGSITVLMQQIARAPPADEGQDWKDVLFPGATIGRFELIRELGRGAFGIVFEARDRQLGRLVAFKAVRPGRHSQVMFRQERLQREAEAVAQLSHPNIVNLYDAGSCQSGPYLIFELLRGETLQARMRRAAVPLAEALDVAIQVAWALDHAHAARVVHRDLKPANVFLCTGGRVKVLDFGISHVLGAGDARAVGTPAYMAPEQWREGPQDARTDIFGAAAMFFETLAGRLPYQVTAGHSTVLDRGARPPVEGLQVPPPLKDLLRAGLAADPAERPGDGHAWLMSLLSIQRELDHSHIVDLLLDKDEELRARPAVPGARAHRGHLRALRIAAVAVGALAALALAVWLALR
ncbi:MAG TPA: FHA domain-containing serine/threonine-protein kinase [Anaeromyxobacteraceae bacterium]|nr:FHA domain-containing serine/threonine-protein kinase [Anaeromyxobacteraceae bacterium]